MISPSAPYRHDIYFTFAVRNSQDSNSRLSIEPFWSRGSGVDDETMSVSMDEGTMGMAENNDVSAVARQQLDWYGTAELVAVADMD